MNTLLSLTSYIGGNAFKYKSRELQRCARTSNYAMIHIAARARPILNHKVG